MLTNSVNMGCMAKASSSILLGICLLMSVAGQVRKSDKQSVTLLILNQQHRLHELKALKLSKSLQKDATKFSDLQLDVQVGSLSFPHLAYWTYFPLLEEFQSSTSDWFVLVNEYATVDLDTLQYMLREKHNSSYIGRALHDTTSSALHHYARVATAPPYPDTRTGIVLSKDLLREAASKYDPGRHDSNFVIDPAYEFSTWLQEECEVKLEHSDVMCVGPGHQCGVTAGNQRVCQASSLTADDVGLHVAIKTYSANHKTRLPILKKTWLPDATSHGIYSDVTDRTAGTVSIGVPNTERGHCAKTMAILDRVLQEVDDWYWLLVADDDTLISVPRLTSLISCYDPSESLALGEVYGFTTGNRLLLHYQTGGSGMVYSRPMVSAIVSSPLCSCRSPNEPDDMMLGACLNRLGHTIVHVTDMHQNNAPNYADGRLQNSLPISFHNFWLIDPVEQYNKWLRGATSPKTTQDNKPTGEKERAPIYNAPHEEETLTNMVNLNSEDDHETNYEHSFIHEDL